MTEPDQEPLPTCLRCTRPPSVGLLCTRCSDNLKRWLADIPDLYAIACTLDIRDRPAGQQDGSRHTKVSGSPALVNVTLMAIQDPRSGIGDGIIPVVPAITGWAVMFAEEQQLQAPAVMGLYEAVSLLTTWWTTLLRQPWIDEMHDEVRDIHRMLSSATNAPKSIGRCFGIKADCGQPLYPGVDSTVTCTRCGRKYSGLALLKVQIQAEHDTKGSA